MEGRLEWEGDSSVFFGRFPRLSGWFHGQYICPTLCCRDAGLFIHSVRARVCVCVCVWERERERERERASAFVRAEHSVWRWGSQLVSPWARFCVPLKGNGLLILGRTLPGNTIAKTFHCWVQLGNSYSFWNSTRSSKNTTQGRKGRRREERKEKGRENRGWILLAHLKVVRESWVRWGSVDVIGASPCVCMCVCVCVCVYSACDILALCLRMVTVLCRGMLDDIFPDIS